MPLKGQSPKRLYNRPKLRGFCAETTRQTAELDACIEGGGKEWEWRIKISVERRRRGLLVLTLDGSNASLEVVLLVKLGNSANFFNNILGDQLTVVDGSIPVDPAGGHRYWNSIKTCESRVARTRRTAQ